uniref:Uncharacterized protein n=1 Tax=Piliocolobus tephrosceles TaxID=591936 RepID=A0A8C9GSB7_9PRIM
MGIKNEKALNLVNLISDNYLESYNTDTFQKVETFNKSEYILTASGNIVCKESILCGMKNIHMIGKSIIKQNVILRVLSFTNYPLFLSFLSHIVIFH